jgi:DNA-binding transcriptional MerR regulator
MAKLSGIKAHTIRIWEQRYGLLQPKRTPTNIRYYEEEDLKRLLNIALLNKNGYRVSKISDMDEREMFEKVAEISEVSNEYPTQLDALTLSMIEMDEFKFGRIINANTEQIGFERTMLEVIYPFLDKLGILGMTGSILPIQVNFISCLIRQKMIVAIDKLPLQRNFTNQKFLLYLPEGEKQELSLLFLSFLLRVRGFEVSYTGVGISLIDLKDACRIQKPDFIYTMISEPFSKVSVSEYIDTLSNNFEDVELLFSGHEVVGQGIKSQGNVKVLGSLAETIAFMEEVKERNQRTFAHSYGL